MTDPQIEETLPPMTEFLDFLRHPEDMAIQLLWKNKPAIGDRDTPSPAVPVTVTTLLRKTCASLFQEIESLGQKYWSLADPKQPSPSSLSGLEQLYTGTGIGATGYDDADGDADNDTDAVVDAETLWGQVELQNTAIHKLLKRSVKQMSKAEASDIRLLDGIVGTEDESDDREAEEDDQGSSQIVDDDEDSIDEESDLDQETKRIRDRMKRTMKDMEDDDEHDSSDSSGDGDSVKKNGATDEDLETDPDAANLHDGFFNLQEMEAFADEEEEYLPEDAYGPIRPEDDGDGDDRLKDKRSFHQRQRDGDMHGGDSDDDDVEEEEGNDLLVRKESTVRRKKYRQDDEIDALYSLYDAPANDDHVDNESEIDVINMTAADLFGKPNPKYFEKWNSKSRQEKTFGDKDADSWNDFDFDRDKQETGWNDDGGDDEDDEEFGSAKRQSDEESEEERGQGGENSDEAVPMKGNNRASSQQKPPTKQAAKILAQTEQLEKEMLAEKPWQMTGETGSSSRPLNSLLDSTPEFEVASKMAPVITVEHTADLEEVVKKRILAEDWDDVIPRELPDIGWHKKRGELPEVSQEKAKLGLGELYEREYLKKAVGYDVDAAEKQTEEEKAKNEMKTLFANLCSKLDALSNYHFAPRPIAAEAEVRPVTMPAIAMEEVLPIHVSDARGVAPEEIYGAKRGRDAILRNDSELNQQERKRLRGSKKAARRKVRKEKLADEKLISRLQPGIGLNNPYEKRKIREELSMARAGGRVTTGVADMNDNYGASGTFFKRMQQEAEQAIRGENNGLEDKKPAARLSGTSSALKL